ncbi:MAG: response regulator [Candidatus Brocadia sp.]|nr:response regulator [Candidatus Brocadia sp.]
MAKPRLLLIDDNKNTLDGLVKILKGDGYLVSGVLSGRDALKLLSEESFDIIITDMNMSGMSGLSLIHEVRKRNTPIAIVVVTGSKSVKTAIEAMKYGADDYLTKPVNVNELILVLKKIWDKRQLTIQTQLLKEE